MQSDECLKPKLKKVNDRLPDMKRHKPVRGFDRSLRTAVQSLFPELPNLEAARRARSILFHSPADVWLLEVLGGVFLAG